MNTNQNIDFGGESHRAGGGRRTTMITNKCNFDFASQQHWQSIAFRQPWEMEERQNHFQPSTNLSNSTPTQFGSPSPVSNSLYNQTDQFLQSGNNHHQFGLSSPQAARGYHDSDMAEQAAADSDFQTGNTTPKGLLYGDQLYSSEKYNSRNYPGVEHLQQLKTKLPADFGRSDERRYLYPSAAQHEFSHTPLDSTHGQLSFSSQSQQEKQVSSSGYPSGNCAIMASNRNSVPSGTCLTNKTRIRWSPDLHDKFVECVNRLGGSDKATPKAILKLMNSDALTIFHVKSHLQKYRIAKHMPESTEARSDRRSNIDDITQIDIKTGLQLKEALQLQLDVQRRLHEQLEIQRNLQLRIEEQGRQLKMMFDQQQKTRKTLLGNNEVVAVADTTLHNHSQLLTPDDDHSVVSRYTDFSTEKS